MGTSWLNMEVIVRDLKREECRELRQLIQELAEYEKCPEGPTITVEELEEDGFGTKPFFHCKAVMQEGVKMNCGRCTWHVLDWNLPSIEFYKRRGAANLTHEDGKLIFQMNTEAIQRFVGTT